MAGNKSFRLLLWLSRNFIMASRALTMNFTKTTVSYSPGSFHKNTKCHVLTLALQLSSSAPRYCERFTKIELSVLCIFLTNLDDAKY